MIEAKTLNFRETNSYSLEFIYDISEILYCLDFRNFLRWNIKNRIFTRKTAPSVDLWVPEIVILHLLCQITVLFLESLFLVWVLPELPQQAKQCFTTKPTGSDMKISSVVLILK